MSKQVTSQQKHSKQAGFTLIELVIVIIILGILAATAAPKFLDLKGDAQGGALRGVKTALEGAASITYSRAAMAGNEATDASTLVDKAGNTLNIVFGYPKATSAALGTVAELDDWDIADGAYITPKGATPGTATGKCQVTYTAPTAAGDRPVIEVNDTEC